MYVAAENRIAQVDRILIVPLLDFADEPARVYSAKFIIRNIVWHGGFSRNS